MLVFSPSVYLFHSLEMQQNYRFSSLFLYFFMDKNPNMT